MLHFAVAGKCQTRCRFRFMMLCWVGLLGLFTGFVPDARASWPGISVIGMENYTDDQIVKLGDLIKNRNVEICFLPFEFSSTPFHQASKLANYVLANGKGSIQFRTYLYWDSNHQFNYSAFALGQGNNPFQIAYRKRLAVYHYWMKSLSNHRIGHVCVPILEDMCTSSSAYAGLLNVIHDQQVRDHVSIPVARSFVLSNATFFRPGNTMPIELHGQWKAVRGYLHPGDHYSNDGTSLTPDQYISAARSALSGGVSPSYHKPVYNGIPPYTSATLPSKRYNLKPFSNVELAELKRVLDSAR